MNHVLSTDTKAIIKSCVFRLPCKVFKRRCIYNINGFKKFHFRKVGYKKKAETSSKFSLTKLFYKKVIKYIFKAILIDFIACELVGMNLRRKMYKGCKMVKLQIISFFSKY